MILGAGTKIVALENDTCVKTWDEKARKIGCISTDALAVLRDNEIFVKTASEYNKIGENGTFHTLTNQIITANTKMLEVYKWSNASLNKIKSIPLKIERPTAVITNQPVGGSHMFIGAVGSVTSVSNTNHSSSVISQEKLPINADEPVIDFALVSGDRRKLGLSQLTKALLYDTIAEKTVSVWSHHIAPIQSLQFSPVSPELGLTAAYDFRLKLFDLRTSQIVVEEKFSRPIAAAIFENEGSVLVSDLSGFIHRFDLRKTKSEVIFGETDIKATCLTIAIDGFKHDEILNPVAEVYENNLESLDASWQAVSTFSDTLSSEISNSMLSVSPVRSTPQSSATPSSHIQRRSFQPPIPSPLAVGRNNPVGLPTPTLPYEIGAGDAPVVSTPMETNGAKTFRFAETDSNEIVDLVQSMQNHIDSLENRLLDRIDSLESKIEGAVSGLEPAITRIDDMVTTIHDMPVGTEYVENQRADWRLFITQPLRDSQRQIWKNQQTLADAIVENRNRADRNYQMLEGILNELRRIRLPVNNFP